jgi:hypothetical protein
MDLEQLLLTLDVLTSPVAGHSPDAHRDIILGEVLSAFRLKIESSREQVNVDKELRRRIFNLLRSRQASYHAPSLDLLAARALESQMLIGVKGNIRIACPSNASTIVETAETRWLSLSNVTDDHDGFLSILSLDPRAWTPTIAQIFADLIYCYALFPQDIIQRLMSVEIQEINIEVLSILLHAVGDHLSLNPISLPHTSSKCLEVSISRLASVLTNEHASSDLQSLCFSAIKTYLSVAPLDQTVFRLLQDEVESLAVEKHSPIFFDLAVASLPLGNPSNAFVASVIDYGLQWSVRYFSGNSGHPEINSVLEQFGKSVFLRVKFL